MMVRILFLAFTYSLLQTPAQVIPSFNFYRADGKPYTRKDIPRNRNCVFLFVDPSCDHCQKAIGIFNEQYKWFRSASVLVVSMSEQAALQYFLTTYAPGLSARKNVITLQDKQYSFITLFGPRKYPGMFLYDANNRLLHYEDDGLNIFRLVNAMKKVNHIKQTK